MKVTTEPIQNREMSLTVEVEPERVQQEMQRAARSLAGRGKIPGYRKGKAPYHVVARYYGEDTIFDEMLDDLVQAAYREALDQTKIEPYAAGKLVDVQKDPLTIKLSIPLPPTVDLDGYRDIRKDMPKVRIGVKQVDEALEKMRREQATWEPVDRPTVEGDMISVTYTGEVDGKVVFEEREDFPLIAGKPYGDPIPGFSLKLIGAKPGDTLEFDMGFPEDDPRKEYAGKQCHFKVHVTTVREEVLPPLDDDLAKVVGDYDDLKALRAHVRDALRDQEKQRTRSEFADEMMKAIVAQSTIGYPPIMLEEEIDAMVEDMERRLKREGQDLDAYLSLSGQSRDEFRESLRPRAEQNLQRALVLGEVIKQERIRVSQEEFEQEYTRLRDTYLRAGASPDLVESRGFQSSVYMDLRAQKAYDRIVQIAEGEAPPIPEEGEAEAQPEAAAEAEATAEPEAAMEAEPATEAAGDDQPASSGE